MGPYQDATKDIPWTSLGRETIVSKLAKSILPIGKLPYKALKLPEDGPIPFIDTNHPDREKFLMNIHGTAIQAGEGKLVTCCHVMDSLNSEDGKNYILNKTIIDNTVMFMPYPVPGALKYVDPRTNKVNPGVDLAVAILPAKKDGRIPYDIPVVKWGDSSKLGLGDQVVVGGYPLGTDLFLLGESNRGLIQPTFYSGIISAIIPALKPSETRIIQVSIPVAGGMSGGAMFDPTTGEVLGMVTSGVNTNGVPQPMTYVIPSEIIAPYVKTITFKTE